MKRSRINELIVEEVTRFGKNPKKQAFNEAQATGDEYLDAAIKAYSKQMGGVMNEADLRDLHEALKKKLVERFKAILGIGDRREV